MGLNVDVLQGFYNALNEKITGIEKVYVAENIDHIDNPVFPCIAIGDFDESQESEGSGSFSYEASINVTVYTEITDNVENALFSSNTDVIFFAEIIIDLLNTNNSISNVCALRASSTSKTEITGLIASKSITFKFDLININKRVEE